ncbi:MAG: hypothetical protein QNL91_08510 [Candidatus Krumholzibacteria bacterium]|nr:hypothetical protein [Candidatus Krumholzibacteria bacterium]
MNARTHTLLAITMLALGLCHIDSALAEQRPHLTNGGTRLIGGSADLAKAAGDTILLMGPTGSGAPYIGDFETGMNGWTSVDLTQPSETHWQVSDYNQSVAGNLAAWCGSLIYPSCNDSLDVLGGYGNNWNEILEFRQTVANPAVSTLATTTATLQHDSEPGYDFTKFGYRVAGQNPMIPVRTWDGQGVVEVSESVNFLPGEYIDGTDIVLQWRFKSDDSFSDEDCSWPTAGACQIDDISVMMDNGGVITSSFADFQDGSLGDWVPQLPRGVGDYAQRWAGLADIDPCGTNFSWQVAFIDNGVVVPGTGGSDCINWCYGPGGYIVNTTGGLAGPDSHMHNEIWSPAMVWPNSNFDGARYAFDVMQHEDLTSDAPGMFFTWDVRSAISEAELANATWKGTNSVFYGNPEYRRFDNDITGYMTPGRTYLQVNFGVYELGFAFGWVGNDGYPAPYFDNAAVRVFPINGPILSTRELELAQDNFPEVDAINFNDLGSMHVRFDMANNISPQFDLRNDPGDSITINVVAARSGATLLGLPQLHYTMAANPVFDAFRSAPTTGVVAGQQVLAYGAPQVNKFAFDLPDSGLLFPGDVLHYYFRAEDDVAGDIRAATLPADLTGYGDFSGPQTYASSYVVHALPSIHSDGFGGYEVPPVLFWNDFANRGGETEWYQGLNNLGMRLGIDYDIYYTNAPTSGVGNGIGGRTSGLALEYYSDMLYTSGDLFPFTISGGPDAYGWGGDVGNDVAALLAWMSAGNKDLLLTGDNVASDLAFNSSALGIQFASETVGVALHSTDLRLLIGNESSPRVLPMLGNPVFQAASSWMAYGGCRSINAFDAVTPAGSAQRLAEFGDNNGNPGLYSYSAATLNLFNLTNRVISLPYDLSFIYDDPAAKVAAPLAARTRVLRDVLDFFGVAGQGFAVSPVPEAKAFAVSNYPNPFNPATRIDYQISRAGPLSLKVFNLRGQLVRTLIDGDVIDDGFVMWDGTNNQGGAVASGVYFYEARSGGEVKIGKMALIK